MMLMIDKIFYSPIMDHDMVLNQHFTCSKYFTISLTGSKS